VEWDLEGGGAEDQGWENPFTFTEIPKAGGGESGGRRIQLLKFMNTNE
jgi:hypothetical protein